MTKRVLTIISIFLIGIAGGLFAGQVLSPYLSKDSFLGMDSAYFARMTAGPVYITENKEVTVQENVVLQDSAEKIKNAIVGIKSTFGGKTIYGSGIVVTTDGLMVTLSEIVPRGGNFVFYVDGKIPSYKILKRDQKNNLALLKVDAIDLKTTGFADLEELRTGQRVFLAGIMFKDNNKVNLINEGIIRFVKNDSISTNIFEDQSLRGSSLFNIKGELLGLNTINKEGRVETIPISAIRSLTGF